MASEAASQSDAARNTASKQAEERKLREEAPKTPSPANESEEEDDGSAPIVTQLLAFVNIDIWCEEKRATFETSLKSIPREVAEEVAKELQATYQQHIDTTYSAAVQAKKNIMQTVKEDWFTTEAQAIIKQTVTNHEEMAKFVPLVSISELPKDEQARAEKLLRKLRPGDLLQLREKCEAAWQTEMETSQISKRWTVKEALVSKMKKAFFRKHYYSIMADVLNTAKFVFEPLVNPTALEDKEKQQRALEIWGQVQEHHLEAIQWRLRDEWEKAKEPFEGLTKEDIEEAKNDFHLHTYWDIVADIVETAGPTKGEKIDAAELETSQGDSETLNSELNSFNMNNKRETEPPCIVATPQKRRRTRDSVTSIQNQSPVMDILSVHTKSRVNQMCSLEVGVMMVVEDELRQVTKNNIKTGVPEDASVGNLHLADAQGIITCSLWRKVAEDHWEELQKKVEDTCPRGMVPFFRLTHLRITPARAPSLTPLKKLNSTDQTVVEFLEFRATQIALHESLVLNDWNKLQRPLPYVTCLQGVVAEPLNFRLTANGAPMCSFALVRNGLSVPCCAMGANAEHEWLRCNTLITIVGALAQDDRQKPGQGNGALWIHDDVFVMNTGQAPKTPKILRSLSLPG